MIFVGIKVSKGKQNNEMMFVVYVQCVLWKKLFKISHFSKDVILYFILYYPYPYCFSPEMAKNMFYVFMWSVKTSTILTSVKSPPYETDWSILKYRIDDDDFIFLSFTFWYCFGIVNPQNYKYWAVLSWYLVLYCYCMFASFC